VSHHDHRLEAGGKRHSGRLKAGREKKQDKVRTSEGLQRLMQLQTN
jgi:hypothetical protein